MDTFEANWTSLVRRYADAGRHEHTWLDRAVTSVAFGLQGVVIGALLSVLIFGDGALATPLGWVPILGVVGISGIAAIRWNRRLENAERDFLSQGPTPELTALVVDGIRGDIERQRGRTLGAESEWGQTRASLDEAHVRASSSVAYWRERLDAEPDSELAAESLAVAEQLEAKFGTAIEGLDGQVSTLRGFFDACDARLARMESFRRDLEETEELRALSAEADDLVSGAQRLVGGIAADFLIDAMNVSGVLASMEEVRLLESAETRPIEELELVAQELIENSRRQQELIGTLLGQVG